VNSSDEISRVADKVSYSCKVTALQQGLVVFSW